MRVIGLFSGRGTLELIRYRRKADAYDVAIVPDDLRQRPTYGTICDPVGVRLALAACQAAEEDSPDLLALIDHVLDLDNELGKALERIRESE